MEQVQETWEFVTRPAVDARALTPPTARAERIASLLVLAVLAVALLLGLALKSAVQSRTATYSDAWITFAYPAWWVVDQDEAGDAALRNPRSASTLFNDRIIVFHDAVSAGSGLPGATPLVEAATAWTLRRSGELDTFRNLATADGYTVAGQPAIRVDYAYVDDPSARLGRPGIPVVVMASDFVIITGEQVTILSGQSSRAGWDDFQAPLNRILENAQMTEGG